MKIIGITGGVGSGKSALLKEIEKQTSCLVIYSDDAAKETEKPGGLSYDAIVELLGEDILDENGLIVNQKMAQKIFSDASLLAKVNAIIHPAVKSYIRRRIREEIERGEVRFFIIEAALLIEEHYDEICDELWYVYAPEKVRRERLKSSRGYSDEKITKMLHSQLSDEAFRKGCNRVIDNSADLETALSQVRCYLEEI